ncbi:MAG: CGNR zinc finger domain-containing protein [Chloroflexota bacterium]|nr:CGNR zinc finger domain-containing protein [Chloroflexota bacterium]
MPFAYYTSIAVELAASLANTLHPATGQDALQDQDDLARYLASHAATVAQAAQEGLDDLGERASVRDAYAEALATWEITSGDVAAVRALRSSLRRIFEVAGEDATEAAKLINAQLSLSDARPRISWQHGPMHLHYESPEDGCAGWLAATTLTGLAVVVCEYGADRLGICASSSCQQAFIDLSKNVSKRYCSHACAHRASVAAFRARRGAAERGARM